MKIWCKIESVVGVNFKKLLTKIVKLIFKYILSSYFIQCGWRCSNVLIGHRLCFSINTYFSMRSRMK